jgi:hypothetical protein
MIHRPTAEQLAQFKKKETAMAEEKTAQAQEKAKGGKKINKMSLAEIEKKLAEVKSAQGGLSSRYARELQRRQNFLRAGRP